MKKTSILKLKIDEFEEKITADEGKQYELQKKGSKKVSLEPVVEEAENLNPNASKKRNAQQFSSAREKSSQKKQSARSSKNVIKLKRRANRRRAENAEIDYGSESDEE